jgi:hypothetical protein
LHNKLRTLDGWLVLIGAFFLLAGSSWWLARREERRWPAWASRFGSGRWRLGFPADAGLAFSTAGAMLVLVEGWQARPAGFSPAGRIDHRRFDREGSLSGGSDLAGRLGGGAAAMPRLFDGWVFLAWDYCFKLLYEAFHRFRQDRQSPAGAVSFSP